MPRVHTGGQGTGWLGAVVYAYRGPFFMSGMAGLHIGHRCIAFVGTAGGWALVATALGCGVQGSVDGGVTGLADIDTAHAAREITHHT